MNARAAALAVCAVVLASACTGGGSDTTSGTQRFIAGDGVVHVVRASSRKPGPALSGTALDGKPLDVASLGSGPLVVNVWGSWCAPCKAEQPELERVHRATSARGVAFLGINVKDPGITAPKAHVKKYDVTYPSLYDPAGKLLPLFRIVPKTIPSTFVLDRQRRIAAYVYGSITEKSLTELVEQVLAE